jgi:5'-nucleotidase
MKYEIMVDDSIAIAGLNGSRCRRLMPKILVTNDDGYFSEGIETLYNALEAIGEVTMVAPASEQSATAHSLTLTRPLRARQIAERRYMVEGTPTDCVLLALTKILPERPDIVVSGINHGANLGDDVTYSGTVAGALEASVFKLPGIAVSLTAREGDFTPAANFAADLTVKVLKEGLPAGTILNVNVPVGEIRGARLTHLGVVAATPEIVEGVDPRGKTYYWIGIQRVSWKEDRGSDFAAISDGLVSITPLRTDMTDYRTLETLRGRDLFTDVQS